MNAPRYMKKLRSGRTGCGHKFCDDCKTRRGSKRGVRKNRHDTKRALRNGDVD